MEEGYETASSGGCVFMFRLTSQRVKVRSVREHDRSPRRVCSCSSFPHLKRYPCLALTASGAGCSSFAKVSPCVTTRVAASVEGQSLSGGWLVVWWCCGYSMGIRYIVLSNVEGWAGSENWMVSIEMVA